jgi:hypothetical protein
MRSKSEVVGTLQSVPQFLESIKNQASSLDLMFGRGEHSVDRSQSSIVIDVPETLHSQRERSRVHAQGRRTDDDTGCTLW